VIAVARATISKWYNIIMTEQKAVSISEILRCENVIIKEDGFKDIGDLIDFGLSFIISKYEDSNKPELNIIKEKIEKSPSFYTVFENGLFIPHLKLENISEFKSVLIVTPKPVKDEKTNHNIYITFMLFSPMTKNFFEKHLNILSTITMIFKDSVIKGVIKLKNSSDICSYIKSIERNE